MRQLTAVELSRHLASSSPPRLVDVREPWELDVASIDGALHIPMGQIPQRYDEIDRTHPAVVICHHGVRSLQVVAFLERIGFANLHNLQGGIDAWARDVDPRVPVY
ncbi:MAG TPA: rhodanese-like domain-containing protein [Usitatibacteraceae bacterium]|nr:rhodanese-like domain-containing protein [Usitatibacteraceae bacterium]